MESSSSKSNKLKVQLVELINKTGYIIPDQFSEKSSGPTKKFHLSHNLLSHLGKLWTVSDSKRFRYPVVHLDTVTISTISLLILMFDNDTNFTEEQTKNFYSLNTRGYSLFYYVAYYSSCSTFLRDLIPELLSHGCNPYEPTCFLSTNPFCAAIMAENYEVLTMFLQNMNMTWNCQPFDTFEEKLEFWKSLGKSLGQHSEDWRKVGLSEKSRGKCFDCILDVYNALDEDADEVFDIYIASFPEIPITQTLVSTSVGESSDEYEYSPQSSSTSGSPSSPDSVETSPIWLGHTYSTSYPSSTRTFKFPVH